MLIMPLREHHDNLIVRLEVTIVECLQIAHRCILALIQDGNPSCDSAVSAIHDRKVFLCLLGIQVMRDLISNLLWINLCNKAAQFAHPKLNLNEQERTQFGR